MKSLGETNPKFSPTVPSIHAGRYLILDLTAFQIVPLTRFNGKAVNRYLLGIREWIVQS